MRVLVCGASGCIGRAVTAALRAHGHEVVEGGRRPAAGGLHVDYTQPVPPEAWAVRLRGIDAVVNAVGILMEHGEQSFERLHAQGPLELFRGAALAGVRRVVQVSALGVGREPGHLRTPYATTKLAADEALMHSDLDWTIVRPSLVFGPHSQSAALFQTLASLPVVSLPGGGGQRVQPIHVYEVAEVVCRLIEHDAPLRRIVELAGPQPITYREMLAAYRCAQGLADPIWLPVPMSLMRLGARVAEHLPQQVFSTDTLAMLENGNLSARNAAPAWLGRAPTALADALPQAQPAMPGPLQAALRWSIAAMWLYTSLITALFPHESNVLALLARCGFEGEAGVAMMWMSCTLNTALGLWLVTKPSAWCYAVQCGAVVGYTVTAAVNMPELTIDHCGPLIKNVPVLALLVVLWFTQPLRACAPSRARLRSRWTADTRSPASPLPGRS